MSIYNKPDLKINIGCNTPSFHKKINSMNFSSSNTGRSQKDNSKKYISKNKFDLKHHTNINSESNVINYNNQQIISNSSINKVLTSANLKNRRIEIDLNKNNSPNSKFNKSVGDNNILFKHKQSTSQNNINNKIINYNINNGKEINHNKSKNSLNNINININISKKIISTYYNKSKDKKNLIVKKKSINSLNNSNKKESKNNKYTQINNNFNNKEDIKKNNNENFGKNQSERIFKKIQNNDSYLVNYYSNQIKNAGNHNSLAYFSTNSNMSTNTNKNNNMNSSNIYKSNNSNYTRDDIYNNYYSNRDINKKNNSNVFNKIIKENKSTCFSQFQSPIGINHTQGNINSIQNYLKFLNIGHKNKNYKNTPIISKNKAHKLSANNINYNHNNTESNIYNNNYNSIYNYETHTTFSQNNYNKLNDDNDNLIPNLKNKKIEDINKKGDIKEINGFQIGSPEELHYFYVKLLQKGKKVNFDLKNKK